MTECWLAVCCAARSVWLRCRAQDGSERFIGRLELAVCGEAGEVSADDNLSRLVARHLTHQLTLHAPTEVRCSPSDTVVEQSQQPLRLTPALAPSRSDCEVNVCEVQYAIHTRGSSSGSGQ